MKKYIQPTIEVTEIEAVALMAASTGISDTPAVGDPIDDANQILSRDHNFSIWGEDED